MRECVSCGSRDTETGFPPRGRLCDDCLTERPHAESTGKPRTRASYRAALRHRQQSPQMDLIDLITPVPGGSL